MQFDTTINEWHTCPDDGRINAQNPCSEYMFLDDTACNLASLNLLKFYDTGTARSMSNRSDMPCRLWTLILEICVYMAQFPSQPVAQTSLRLPHARPGLRQPGRLADGAGHSLRFARRPGAVWRPHGDHARGRLRHVGGDRRGSRAVPALRGQPRAHAARGPQSSPGRLQRAGHRIRRPDDHAGRHRPAYIVPSTCWPRPATNPTGCSSLGEKYGYRNAQVTCIAPTGTIGLVMDCDTTGIEPDFALVKFKKLAGGGYFKIINASMPPALARLGYTPEQIDDIVRYCRGAGTLEGCPHINPATLKAKGFTDEVLQNDRGQSAGRLRSAVRLQSLDARRRLPPATSSASSRKSIETPTFDLLDHLGFSGQQIAEANANSSAAP